MRIGDSSPLSKQGKAKKASKKSGSGFSDAVAGGTNGAELTSGAAHSGGVMASTSLLMSQDVTLSENAQQHAQQQAKQMLDELDHLHRNLLQGNVSKQNLLRMQTLVDAKRHPDTPERLSSVLDEIELRVAVELAKLGL